MSRQRTVRKTRGQQHQARTETPPTTTTRDHSSTDSNAIVQQLLTLQADIAETRKALNARLDALERTIDRLLPQVQRDRIAPPPTTIAIVAKEPSTGATLSLRSPTATPSTKAPISPRLPPPTPAPTAQTHAPSHRQGELRVGDEVYVPRLDGTFIVVEAASDGQTFKVQSGALRVQVTRDELWPLSDRPPVPVKTATTAGARTLPNPHIVELDLHGFTVEEALTTLDLFLHHEYMRRTTRVRIIHGKGTGTLRLAVRRELKRNPLVRAIDPGFQHSGNDGVTLADLDV